MKRQEKNEVDITENEVSMSIDLSGRVFDEDLTAQLAFSSDPQGLNEALVDHANRFAHWAAMECVAKENLEEAKNGMKLLEADLFRRIEKTLTEEQDGKKPTLDRIRSEMVKRDDYQEGSDTVARAQVMLDRIVVGRQAMMHRKDCLIEVARNMRAEMDAGLVVQSRPEKGVENAKRKEERARRKRMQ